ncbi:MAG: phosphatase PAP2 family protein [Candidatus Binataceae bacterium]
MLKRAFFPPAILAIILIGGGVPSGWAQSALPASVSSNFSGELTSDFKYLANNFEADAEDIATAPLHLDAAGAMLTNPRFYLIVGGAGAAFGGSFALDQTMRSHLRSMGSSTADLLQNVSYASVSASTAVLYGYGLYSGDSRARQFALTAGEGAGIATLIDIGIKAGFGRLRPSQSPSHTAFFHGGQSFVSGDVTPMFALAAGVSEYYDNTWYISIPIYSLALLDGFGRMGNDAHWFSDVVGAALLGVGTTELFLYLHRQHDENPGRFRVFPVAPPVTSTHGAQSVAPTGIGVAFSW